jgi:hypothetical protein
MEASLLLPFQEGHDLMLESSCVLSEFLSGHFVSPKQHNDDDDDTGMFLEQRDARD